MPATSESFSARGEERRRGAVQSLSPPTSATRVWTRASTYVLFAQVFHFTKLPCFPSRAVFRAADWREKKRPGDPASKAGERWHRCLCSDKRIRTCPNVSMRSSYYSNIWEREYLFPRAHRLTSLVMRLLFPSRGNLLRRREKKSGIVYARASERFQRKYVFFSSCRRFL